MIGRLSLSQRLSACILCWLAMSGGLADAVTLLPIRWYGGSLIFYYTQPKVADLPANAASLLDQHWVDGHFEMAAADGRRQVVASCAQYFQAQRQQLQLVHQYEYLLYQDVSAMCASLKAFSTARAAPISYVRGFSLSAANVRQLPVELAFVISDEDMQRASRYKTLGAFQKGRLTQVDSNRALWQFDGGEQRIAIIARGDFTGSGREELLIDTVNTVVGGSYRVRGVFIVTRDAPTAALKLVKRLE